MVNENPELDSLWPACTLNSKNVGTNTAVTMNKYDTQQPNEHNSPDYFQRVGNGSFDQHEFHQEKKNHSSGCSCMLMLSGCQHLCKRVLTFSKEDVTNVAIINPIYNQ